MRRKLFLMVFWSCPKTRPKMRRKLFLMVFWSRPKTFKAGRQSILLPKVFGQVSGRFSDRFSGRLSGTVSGPPFWVNFQVFGRTVFGSTWGQLLAKFSGAEHCMRISSNFNIALEINCCATFVQIKIKKNHEKHAGKTA